MLKEQANPAASRIEVQAKSPWAGKVAPAARPPLPPNNLLPLAAQEAAIGKEAKLEVNPHDQTIVPANAVVIVMGDAKRRVKARTTLLEQPIYRLRCAR